jgi:hypothetical protein
MTLRWATVLLLVGLAGTRCATSRVVRLDTGKGRPSSTRRAWMGNP